MDQVNRTGWLLTIFVAVVVAIALEPELIGQAPMEPAAAHRYADSVLFPRFVATMNDWSYQHPKDRPGHDGEHCANLDGGDVARWKLVRETFRELDKAYKRAGY